MEKEKNIVTIEEIVNLKREELSKILSVQHDTDLREAKIHITSFFNYLKKISLNILKNDKIRQEIDISYLIKFTVEKNVDLNVERYIEELKSQINNSRKI